MATYTQLSAAEVASLMANFQVPAIDDTRALVGGRANSSFLVTAGRARYVLTVCDDKGPDEVASLVAVIDHLAGLPCCDTRVLRTATGAASVSRAGRPVIAKTYVEGTVSARLDAEQLDRLGRGLAALHAAPLLAGLPRDLGFGLASFDAVITWPGSGSFGTWLAGVRDRLQGCVAPDLPRGLIHGDLYADNVIWREGAPTFIDFEEATDFYFAFDLGMALVGTAFTDGLVSLPRGRLLLDGYQAGRRLDAAEAAALQDFTAYAAAATACWRFKQYNIRLPGSSEATSYQQLQPLVDEILALPAADFCAGLGLTAEVAA